MSGRLQRKNGGPVSLPKRFRSFEFSLDLCEGFGAMEAARGERYNERSPKASRARSLIRTVQWLDWLNALARGRTDNERTPCAP